ncbi:MAG: flagellar basal-body MS-ring/collar protein FliF [bacterium]|nr:flagellar basal-body MS-ring/collar protein FliF [bacterium]
MEKENQSFISQFNALWGRLNSSERLVLSASVLIILVALAVWISVARYPSYALLYGNLDPTDAGEVISQLQTRNIEYKIKDGGKSILVPDENVDELRISLAADGFSPSGIEGYAILADSPLGLSDFLQRARYDQAIEEELARTLMSLDEVSAARVHLNMPEPTPFISEQVEPSASVVLGLKPGVTLARDRIAAVRTFVAGAIGTMDGDQVTIIDQNMNLLTGPESSDAAGLLPSQEEARRNYELQRAADIRRVLEPAYGLGKVAVSFTCEMDFDEVETESLTYDPISGTEHGVLISEEMTEDSVSGDGYNTSTGVPGTTSNIPSYPGASGAPFASDSSTTTKNYETSSTHEMRTQAPGTLKSCSVSVVIDKGGRDASTIGSTEISEVQDIVAGAAGLDLSTGDSITVAFKDFDTSLQDDLAKVPGMTSGEIMNLVVRFVIAFLVLLVFWTILKSFLKPLDKTVMMTGASQEEIEDYEVELPDADPATLEKLKIREEIEKMIKEDPAAASKVIKTWLKE